jgi:AraC-like DNA-binding protein
MNHRLELISDWQERAVRANWCVQRLAKQCGVSRSTLERHIKSQAGECPHDWLEQMRMERAMELLSRDIPVKEASSRLGYQNPHHFSRVFKNHKGYPPSKLAAVQRAQGWQI